MDEEPALRIIVCVKEVIDLAQVRFKSDGRIPVLDGLPVRLGAFEKNALEEAVRIKERLGDVEVLALSAGSGKLKESIKEALAIGADRAVLVQDTALDGAGAERIARALALISPMVPTWIRSSSGSPRLANFCARNRTSFIWAMINCSRSWARWAGLRARRRCTKMASGWGAASA